MKIGKTLFMCRKQCYTKLQKLDSTWNKLENIKSELKTEFKTRFKQVCHPLSSAEENNFAELKNSRAVKSLRFPEAL